MGHFIGFHFRMNLIQRPLSIAGSIWPNLSFSFNFSDQSRCPHLNCLYFFVSLLILGRPSFCSCLTVWELLIKSLKTVDNLKCYPFWFCYRHFKTFCLQPRPAASAQEITGSLSLLGPEVGETVKEGHLRLSVSVAKRGIHNTGTIKKKIIIYWTVFLLPFNLMWVPWKLIFLFESLETNANIFVKWKDFKKKVEQEKYVL